MSVDVLFEEAVDKIFKKWTILALAIDQGWGGRDSRAKGLQLQQETIDYFGARANRKRPLSADNETDRHELTQMLYGRLDEMFNAECEDGSDEEVAYHCLKLFQTCKAGDLSYAQQIIKACEASALVNLSQCQGVDVREYATEEDQLLDQMQGMDLDDVGSHCSDDGFMNEEDLANAQIIGDAAGYPTKDEALIQPVVAADTVLEEKKTVQKELVPEPVVDEDGFTSVVKTNRKMKAR